MGNEICSPIGFFAKLYTHTMREYIMKGVDWNDFRCYTHSNGSLADL